MHFQIATVTILLSSILSVQGLSLGGLQDRGLESSHVARDSGVVNYLQQRQAKQERRRALRQRQNNKGTGTQGGNAAAAVTLNANAIQTGSQQTGQAATADPGQVNSAVDNANFINFCSGQTLTNGLQVKTGSCNGIVMGKIPATTNMISSIITSPKLGDIVTADQTFTISVQTKGLAAGAFTNAQLTYYSAPQDLNGQGQIIGHTHVTVQDLGNSLNPGTVPDPTLFAFFKGINDAGNGNGLLSATVTGGLPAGNYRVCTMTSSANHQPVLMPVAQRGAQDDCTKFVVAAGGAGGGANGGAANGGANGGGKVGGNTGGNTGAGNNAAASSAATAATTAKAAATSAAASTAGSAVTIKSGTLGGAAPAVTNSGDAARPFSVNGSTFVNAAAAIQRSCDVQFNACANLANSGKLNGKTVNDCTAQKSACGAA